MVRPDIDATKHIPAMLADGSYRFPDDGALSRIQGDRRMFELLPVRVRE